MSHPTLERLASPDSEERARACREAAADPAAVVLIDALGDALGDSVQAVARAASDALARLSRRHDVAPVLRRALRGDDPIRRRNAAFTQARLEPPGPTLLPALVEALDCEDGDTRWAAARILVDAGRLHGEVLPLLLGLARGGETPLVRRMAAHCLRELAPDHPESSDALLAATRDPDLPVRRAALTALAALNDPPRAVIQRLTQAAADDPDAASRHLAAAALERLGAARPPA